MEGLGPCSQHASPVAAPETRPLLPRSGQGVRTGAWVTGDSLRTLDPTPAPMPGSKHSPSPARPSRTPGRARYVHSAIDSSQQPYEEVLWLVPLQMRAPRGKGLAHVTPRGGGANTRCSGAGPQTLESPGRAPPLPTSGPPGARPSRPAAGPPPEQTKALLSGRFPGRDTDAACPPRGPDTASIVCTGVSGAGAGASDTLPVT